MSNIERIKDPQIKESVLRDLINRSIESIDKLKEFYFKIITEETIRTSSFRYHHARISLLTICNKINDTETPINLAGYHRSKAQFEINNPIEKKPLETNQVTREQKYGKIRKDKSATPMKL